MRSKEKGNTVADFKFNAETMKMLSVEHGFGIHGDFKVENPSTLAGLTGWDLEFPNMYKAVAFADSISSHIVDVNIRQGDSVSDLDKSVVLTIICSEIY